MLFLYAMNYCYKLCCFDSVTWLWLYELLLSTYTSINSPSCVVLALLKLKCV